MKREAMTENKDAVDAHQLIANFMTASAPLEAYLQQGTPINIYQASLRIFRRRGHGPCSLH
jgi:hypothetical protein